MDPRWRALGPHLRLVGFEPAEEEYCHLSAADRGDARMRFLSGALSDRAGDVMLHVCRSGGNSSCYLPNRRFVSRFPDAGRFDVLKTLTVTARTLDEALADGPPIDFLKINTQGSELPIIDGAHNRRGAGRLATLLHSIANRLEDANWARYET